LKVGRSFPDIVQGASEQGLRAQRLRQAQPISNPFAKLGNFNKMG
jgi:hypothetical protein